MTSMLLCLLTTGLMDQSPKNTSKLGSDTENSVWWNPTDSYTDPLPSGFEIHQGDILIPENENLKNAIKSKNYLWENGLIPYEFGDNFTSTEKNVIYEAMKILEIKTCVKFNEKEEEETYIQFQKSKSGCFAPIGRLPGNNGVLPVNLQSPECFKETGIAVHELLHVVGLFHEQSRPDRDDYVKIHWCNIEPQQKFNFDKGNDKQMDTFSLPYDFGSIMHYPKWAFSKNGRPTITAKENPDMELGQRKGPSEVDIQKVNKMYGCKV